MTRIKKKHLLIALFIGVSLGLLENIAAQFLLDHFKWAEVIGFIAFIVLFVFAAYWINQSELIID